MKIKRILLKLSGEYLAGDKESILDSNILASLSQDIAKVVKMGVEVGIVVGGGNILRGKSLADAGLGRVTGDHMGLLATVINGLALNDALEKISVPVRVLSSVGMVGIVERFSRGEAIRSLSQKQVVIFTGGTGNPFFTTDTGACLRAIEIDADVVFKATKVDGVYSDDPVKNKDALHYDKISYDEILAQNLGFMDLTAICLCKDNSMPLRVFDIDKPNALIDAASGKNIGTFVYDEGK